MRNVIRTVPVGTGLCARGRGAVAGKPGSVAARVSSPEDPCIA